jgi:hypothetical protein
MPMDMLCRTLVCEARIAHDRARGCDRRRRAWAAAAQRARVRGTTRQLQEQQKSDRLG